MVSIDDLHRIRVETQDLGTADLTLEADRGESLEILARGGTGAATFDSIEETVDETTMLQYFGGSGRPNMFPRELAGLTHADVLARLRQKGAPLPTIKVPAGTTYTMSNLDDGGTYDVYYRDYNTERFGRSDDGAPGGRRKTFITRAREQETITQNTQEEITVETSANTGGVQDWPWEEDVPTNREYDLVGLSMTAREDPAGGGAVTLDNFRLTSQETDFLARNSAFVTDGFADFPDADPHTRGPFWFGNFATQEIEPITFSPGDDLTVTVQATETTNNADVDADILVEMIARERRV